MKSPYQSLLLALTRALSRKRERTRSAADVGPKRNDWALVLAIYYQNRHFFETRIFWMLLLSDAQPSRIARSIALSPRHRGVRNEVLNSDWLTSLIKDALIIILILVKMRASTLHHRGMESYRPKQNVLLCWMNAPPWRATWVDIWPVLLIHWIVMI